MALGREENGKKQPDHGDKGGDNTMKKPDGGTSPRQRNDYSSIVHHTANKGCLSGNAANAIVRWLAARRR